MSKIFHIVLHGSAVFLESGKPIFRSFEYFAGHASSLGDALNRASVLAMNAPLLIEGTRVELVYVSIIAGGNFVSVASYDDQQLKWIKASNHSIKGLELKYQSLRDKYLSTLDGAKMVRLNLLMELYEKARNIFWNKQFRFIFDEV
mgnify:CR=1 FL=1